MLIDRDTEFGRRVESRLKEERVIWLTTISSGNSPHPRPVWFLWNGESFLIFSRPNTKKLRHIARNPQVSLNFDGDGLGGDIVVFNGKASIDPTAPAADQVAEYVEKYRPGFQRISMTPDQFSQTYSVAIRVFPIRVRGAWLNR